MSELSDYSINCDYLRDKFDLPNEVSIYGLINKATDYIRSVETTNSQKEKKPCQKKSTRKLKNKKLKS